MQDYFLTISTILHQGPCISFALDPYRFYDCHHLRTPVTALTTSPHSAVTHCALPIVASLLLLQRSHLRFVALLFALLRDALPQISTRSSFSLRSDFYSNVTFSTKPFRTVLSKIVSVWHLLTHFLL